MSQVDQHFTSLREILHLVTRADLMTIYGRLMTFYQEKKAAGIGLVLWGHLKVLMDSPEVNDVSGLVVHMCVDKKYPLSVNLIERMLDHRLEICHGTMGNELTTVVQLIAFLKKQISDSRRPKVHDCPRLDADFLVADSKFMKVAFGVGFKMIAVPSSGIVTTSRYVVPTGRVKVPAGRYVVPTGRLVVPTRRYIVLHGCKDLSRVGSNRGHEDFIKTKYPVCSLSKLSLEVLSKVGHIGSLADFSAPLNVLSCYVAISTLVWASEVVSSAFPIVKVRRDSKRGPKFTWEREDHMNAKYFPIVC
ncbi:hypothetical protein Tco_1276000 [Tanacetum coccineum]